MRNSFAAGAVSAVVLGLCLATFGGSDLSEHCLIAEDPLFPDSGYGPVVLCDLPVYGTRFANTEDQRDAGHVLHRWANGNGLTMPAFLVGASQNGAPSVATMPGKVNESYGWVEYGDGGHIYRSGMEFYCMSPEGDGYASNTNSCVGIGRGPTSAKIYWWDTRGASFSEGGDMTFISDDNEKHIVARSSRGPNFPARFQFAASDPTGGPAMYVTKTAGSSGDVFQSISEGTVAGFTAQSGVRVGVVQSLPPCNSANKGVILFSNALGCFVGCKGSAPWICLTPEGT